MNLSKRSNFFIILILGALSSVTPFAIDMYLPAFPRIAADFGTTAPRIAFSLSNYLIGMNNSFNSEHRLQVRFLLTKAQCR